MDKNFIFEVKQIDGKLNFRSVGDGFNMFEVIGFLEWKRVDLFNQLSGNVKPDEVTRTRIIEGAKNTEQPTSEEE